MPSYDKQNRREIIRLFAHRGGNIAATENSIDAFESSVKLGYKYLETDVILTKDNKVISYHGAHNAYTQKLSGLKKRSEMQKMTHQEINNLLHSNGLKTPLLEDLLNRFPKAFFSVDAKTWEVVDPLVQLIKNTKSQNRVSITSFNIRRTLIIAKKLGGADLQTALCLYRVEAYPIILLPGLSMKFFSKVGIKCLHVPHRCVNSRLLRSSKKHNILIYAWAVNEKSEIERLLSIGVDGIISDDIKLLKKTAELN